MWNRRQLSSRISASEFWPLRRWRHFRIGRSVRLCGGGVTVTFPFVSYRARNVGGISFFFFSSLSHFSRRWPLRLGDFTCLSSLFILGSQFRPAYRSQALPDWLVGTDLHLLLRGTQGGWGEHIWLWNSPNKILSHAPSHTIMSKPLYGGEMSPPSYTCHPLLTPRGVSTAQDPLALFHALNLSTILGECCFESSEILLFFWNVLPSPSFFKLPSIPVPFLSSSQAKPNPNNPSGPGSIYNFSWQN